MAETASTTITSTQLDQNLYQYQIDLTDTGTTPIGTFWFSWLPGAGYLPDLPAPSSPANWTAQVTDGPPPGNGYSIQWIAAAGSALAPGQSLTGFTFTSASTPAEIFGQSTIHPSEPAGESTVYSAGPFSDAGFAFDAACYCPGTSIATPSGDVVIETLSIGDIVLTVSGAARPIKWIGRRCYGTRFLAEHPSLRPIRIRAGALGGGLPRRDLLVSPEHGMLLDGLLVRARDLVNEVTILRDRAKGNVSYLHIELDSHDVILAEGAPAESFLDDDSRATFHNAPEFHALYPDAPAPGRFYAPRVNDGYELETIRWRLAEVARQLSRAA